MQVRGIEGTQSQQSRHQLCASRCHGGSVFSLPALPAMVGPKLTNLPLRKIQRCYMIGCVGTTCCCHSELLCLGVDTSRPFLILTHPCHTDKGSQLQNLPVSSLQLILMENFRLKKQPYYEYILSDAISVQIC